MKYQSEIIDIGNDALDLYSGISTLILFNDSICDGMLKDISVIHRKSELLSDIEVGDVLEIGDNILKITSIGSIAIETFRNIGHVTLRFTGESCVNLPGEIVVRGKLDNKISVGNKILIK